ncbi:hypothetical protein PEM37_24690 [Streptomyces sp. AD681]|uniref:hypothetical protein n=1 Tax=Streptomyces TaxID=1883 RepID=UPI0013924F64|nr:hypothetical protein [Streptomyces sp. AD681]MDA5144709.1 hypothetical protein [Streptomyces sp. AD681]MYS69703.1 hypothetical protein [Streptomyces sp. SID5926]
MTDRTATTRPAPDPWYRAPATVLWESLVWLGCSWLPVPVVIDEHGPHGFAEEDRR